MELQVKPEMLMALLGAPYIYDISSLRVKRTLSNGSSNAPRADGCCRTYSWSQLQNKA